MTEKSKLSRRVVAARRTIAVGALAATALGTTAAGMTPVDAQSSDRMRLAQVEGEAAVSGEGEGEGKAAADPCAAPTGEGEGEGKAAASGEGEGEGEATASGEGEGEVAASGEGESEGGAVAVDAETCLSRDLGVMEGHLRAGMKLYESGDLAAAKTHMGHAIEEKYDALAGPLGERGYGRLEDELATLAKAAEAESPLKDIRPVYNAVLKTIEDVRNELPAKAQLMAFAMLTRIAADEYAATVEGGKVSNLHEYQDSWGLLRVVEAEAGELAKSDNAEVAQAAAEVLEHLAATDASFGDIQGKGDFMMDPSILHGAAARMELTAIGVD